MDYEWNIYQDCRALIDPPEQLQVATVKFLSVKEPLLRELFCERSKVFELTT